MITALFMVPILAFVLGLASLMPTNSAALPEFLSGSISTASSYVGALYIVAPATTVTLLAIIAFFVIYEGSIFTWKGINWILRRIPTQS